MERPSLQRLFSACDVNKSGKIEYEDFKVVCRELNVPNTDIKTLFDKLDVSGDGYIDFSTFSSKFHEVSETLDLAAFGAGSAQQNYSWEEFADKLDEESLFSQRYQMSHPSGSCVRRVCIYIYNFDSYLPSRITHTQR